ncbi:DUF2523 family protein [Neptunomonas phycophila]|uniref:DUF2523 family protein n=1 Tax=Neptunomonas phycophila TaxID=1572645 RepID=UPI0026E24BD3|nr:DUF2523 family protein [Neptunomonas phycophila]MDO6785908.1 DUF2523 family protein [Neptunomonas phycophila]
MLESISNFFTFIENWINSGIYTFFTEVTAYAIESAILGYINMLAWVIPFAWGVAKVILEDFGITSMIETAWNILPSDTRHLLAFFAVDDALNIILNAAVTKFVLKFLRVL